MIICVGGKHGSGRSSIAKALAHELGATHLSSGDLFRSKALEKNMSIEGYIDFVKKNPGIDRAFDKEFVQKLRDHKGIVVTDSNLAAQFLKDEALKVWIFVSDEKRGRRVFEGQRIGDRKYASEQEALESLKARDEKDRARYIDIYGIDFLDESIYDVKVENNNLIEAIKKIRSELNV